MDAVIGAIITGPVSVASAARWGSAVEWVRAAVSPDAPEEWGWARAECARGPDAESVPAVWACAPEWAAAAKWGWRAS
jgi:hypothetical protein